MLPVCRATPACGAYKDGLDAVPARLVFYHHGCVAAVGQPAVAPASIDR